MGFSSDKILKIVPVGQKLECPKVKLLKKFKCLYLYWDLFCLVKVTYTCLYSSLQTCWWNPTQISIWSLESIFHRTDKKLGYIFPERQFFIITGGSICCLIGPRVRPAECILTWDQDSSWAPDSHVYAEGYSACWYSKKLFETPFCGVKNIVRGYVAHIKQT